MSCNQQSGNSGIRSVDDSGVNVDSLNNLFVAGWNNSDSASIMNTVAEDAIAMNDSLIHQGRNAIAADWVSGGIRVISNIKTRSLIKGVGPEVAYDGGTYTLNINPPGGPLLNERGNYSLVWKKQPDNNWKLTLIHIEDITRLPDVNSLK